MRSRRSCGVRPASSPSGISDVPVLSSFARDFRDSDCFTPPACTSVIDSDDSAASNPTIVSPSLVSAWGVEPEPEFLAALRFAVASPASRCFFVWSLTFGELESSFFAPSALASDSARDSE